VLFGIKPETAESPVEGRNPASPGERHGQERLSGSPGPMLASTDKLRTYRGLSGIAIVQGNKPLAIVDQMLAG
jgi:hypothetical protein